jgi:hypothetical protein
MSDVAAPPFRPDKFKELILYVASRLEDDPSFGATKLNKVLFFSDFLFYRNTGHAITGATYQRLDRGPAPVQLLPVQAELQQEGSAVLVERKHFNYPQRRLLALRDADLSLFTAEEVSLVDEVIELLRHRTAAEVSTFSHVEVLGWQIAGDREEIPYRAALLAAEPLTPADIRRGQELARQHGW